MLTAKTSKRLQTSQAQQRFLKLLNTIKRLLCSSTTARDFYSNRITRKNVWGWTLDIQSV